MKIPGRNNSQTKNVTKAADVKMARRQISQAQAIIRKNASIDLPLSPAQKALMAQMGNRYENLVEVLNPQTNVWERAGSTVKLVNSVLPPDKRLNKENITRVAGRVFSGVPDKASNENVMNSSYGLSKAPNPKRISLNSNIQPNTSANDFMQAQFDLCAPMHVTGASLQIPTSGELFTYFTQTIAFDIQTRAQSNVSYSLDIATRISSAQLLTAFNATIQALNVYFYYTSILSYEADTRNKNQGMINLRQQITPQIISDLSRLGRRLEDTPVPPRMVEWVRYMNGNFLSGDSQGASLIKLCFNPDALTNPNLNAVQDALTNLTSDANNSLFSLLRSAVPQWRIKTLFDVPTIPQFDKNFLTIFANMPSWGVTGGTNQFSPLLANANTAMSYNCYNNKLDGVAFAMSGILVSGSDWQPGLVKPVTSTSLAGVSDSRLSWYTDGTTSSWINVTGNSFLRQARMESYSYASHNTGLVTAHLPGAEKAQNVNQIALTQTAQNVLDFLFKIDSIPVTGKLSSFNRRGNGQI